MRKAGEKRDKRKGGEDVVLMQTNRERECKKGENEITSKCASALIDPTAYKIVGAGLTLSPIQAATGWKDKNKGPASVERFQKPCRRAHGRIYL
jgi:hypothetical protein